MPSEFYLRMSGGKGKADFWRLVSDHERGPAAPLPEIRIPLIVVATNGFIGGPYTNAIVHDETGTTILGPTQYVRLQSGVVKLVDSGVWGDFNESTWRSTELFWNFDAAWLAANAPGYTGGYLEVTWGPDWVFASHAVWEGGSFTDDWGYNGASSLLDGDIYVPTPRIDAPYANLTTPITDFPRTLHLTMTPVTFVPDPPGGVDTSYTWGYSDQIDFLTLVLNQGDAASTGVLGLRMPDQRWVRHVNPHSPGSHPLNLNTGYDWETVLWMGPDT